MSKQEIIIECGVEGGRIVLYGTQTDRGWDFRLDVNDQTPELIDEPVVNHSQAAGSSLQHALKLMDCYPWHKFYPLDVHPEFHKIVLQEVRSRLTERELSQYLGDWQRICQSSMLGKIEYDKNMMASNPLVSVIKEDFSGQATQLNIVYVLSNPAMPGYIKIGHTKQSDAQLRIDQLYTTGVPVPFDLEYACKVQNAEEVERALHTAFGPSRVNPRREFFKINPEQAIAILKLLHTEDATYDVEMQPSIVDPASINASVQLKAKRSNMNFEEMGIRVGEILQSIHGDLTATVCGPKKVIFSDEEMSLTAATRKVLGIEHSVQPSPHWTYQGKLLKEIYEETYSSDN